jgi:hypothetical protein
MRPVALFLALFSPVHGVAWACSCVANPLTPDDLEQYGLIAWGTVLEDETPGRCEMLAR